MHHLTSLCRGQGHRQTFLTTASKFSTSTSHYLMLCPNIAGWVTNSVDPNETSHSGASHWVYTVGSVLSVWIHANFLKMPLYLRIIMKAFHTFFTSFHCSPIKSKPDQKTSQEASDRNPKIPDQVAVGSLTPNSVQHNPRVDEQAVFHSNYHWKCQLSTSMLKLHKTRYSAFKMCWKVFKLVVRLAIKKKLYEP